MRPRNSGVASDPPPRKRRKLSDPAGRLPCYPFDKYRPLPDAEEVARLRALNQDGEEWQEERKKRQGASGASCAVGLGNATPQDYFRYKTHRLEREDDENTQRILNRGHDLEPLGAQAYESLMLCKLAKVGIVTHPTLGGWIHASPDRLIAEGEGAGGVGIVEIKCPLHALPIRIKPEYMCQVQLQMACTGAQWCDLFSYLHDDLRNTMVSAQCWRIWRSESYWQRMLVSLHRFADCLMEDREPTDRDIPRDPTMPKVRTELLLEWEEL
jgi:putative phage-type endonuclease